MRTFFLPQKSSKSDEPFLDKSVSKLEMEMESVDNRFSDGQMLELFFKSTATTRRQLRCGKFSNAQGRTLGHITHFSFRF